MTGVSGLGGWPVSDPLEAQQVVLGQLSQTPDGVTGMPYVLRAGLEPFRDPVGHAVGLLTDLPAQVGPHGWALADRPGRDHAQACAAIRTASDALAVAAHGYGGPLTVPVLGPISLAAGIWTARGDRAVADLGALGELSSSLADGLSVHLRALALVVPGAELHAVLVEPQLVAALAGTVPTFSGHSRIRSVGADVASTLLGTVVAAAKDAGASTVTVHLSGLSGLDVVRRSGADSVGLDPTGWDAQAWEALAAHVEQGLGVWVRLADRDTAGRFEVGWRRVGLPRDGLADVVLVPDGVPSAPAQARAGLSRTVQAGQALMEVARG
jgi:hypothetical protein